jgi:hypothetical protein
MVNLGSMKRGTEWSIVTPPRALRARGGEAVDQAAHTEEYARRNAFQGKDILIEYSERGRDLYHREHGKIGPIPRRVRSSNLTLRPWVRPPCATPCAIDASESSVQRKDSA